jgi:hypothetical protein
MATASALAGPAVSPTVVSAINQIINQVTQNLQNINPVQNKKGSVNQGGGGGGGGSGCGGGASPEQCEEKSKGCGGGGGGCGGGKKANPEDKPLMVAFVDCEGNPIMTDCDGKPLDDTSPVPTPVQKVTKNNACKRPWQTNLDAMKHPQGFIPGLVFEKWSENDVALNQVTKDLAVIPIYNVATPDDLLMMAEQYSAMGIDVNTLIDNSIQQYNDTVDQCIDSINETTEIICGTDTYTKDGSKKTYAGIMPTVASNLDTLSEENKVKCYNILKCILNVQSCYIFRTRMIFNDECNDCKKYIMDSKKTLFDSIYSGETGFKESIKEFNQMFDGKIYDISEFNKENFADFKDNINLYIDDLNNCFSKQIIEKI